MTSTIVGSIMLAKKNNVINPYTLGVAMFFVWYWYVWIII